MAVQAGTGIINIPRIEGCNILVGGTILEWQGEFKEIFSPVEDTESHQKISLGRLPQLDEATSRQVLEYARVAWNHGTGEWPQMPIHKRIETIESLVFRLRGIRDKIIEILMWEICKTRKDATAEFDRTMEFVEASIAELKSLISREFAIHENGETLGKFLRCPLGVVLALGPSNYPLNETYTSIIPALLMGNVVILKIPNQGGGVHLLTQEIFQQTFPKGVMNFMSGPGKVVASTVMKEGVDVLSFVGTSTAADALIHAHPAPHRLKLNLSLEGKNIAIVTASSNLQNAASQVAAGAVTYNGQRCTALKLIFVHSSIVQPLVELLQEEVCNLRVGLPWEEGVKITPLDSDQLAYVQELLQDAKEKGASTCCDGNIINGSLMWPVTLFPVKPDMRIWKEEQFGPVIAIAPYTEIEEVLGYVAESSSGLQCSIFGEDHEELEKLSRVMVNSVGRVNLNVQSGRSPDEFPFTGRKSSANGILSSSEALLAFSLPIVLATKSTVISRETFDHMLQEQL